MLINITNGKCLWKLRENHLFWFFILHLFFPLSFVPLVALSPYLLYPLKHLIKCLSFRQQSSERRAAVCLCTLKLHVSIESTWGHKNSSCITDIYTCLYVTAPLTELPTPSAHVHGHGLCLESAAILRTHAPTINTYFLTTVFSPPTVFCG